MSGPIEGSKPCGFRSLVFTPSHRAFEVCQVQPAADCFEVAASPLIMELAQFSRSHQEVTTQLNQAQETYANVVI